MLLALLLGLAIGAAAVHLLGLAAQRGRQVMAIASEPIPDGIAAMVHVLESAGVVLAEQVRSARDGAGARPLFVLDLGMPSDVEAAVGDLPDVTVVDIAGLGGADEVYEAVESALRERCAAAAPRTVVAQVTLHGAGPAAADLTSADLTLADLEDADLDEATITTHVIGYER